MLYGSVTNIYKPDHVIEKVKKTNNVFERMRGLLFHEKLKIDQALWIEPCPSIHTIGMRYAIDVVFLDKKGQVLKIVENLHPMRMAMCKNAVVSIELLAGGIAKYNIYIGQYLIWSTEEDT